jgi:predicted nucleotidyltransferase
MNLDIDRVKEDVRQISQAIGRKEILAVGLFGSFTRGDYDKRSDIDIFIITEKDLPLKEQDELYFAFSELIPRFGRDISVLVYDINGLKKIPTWQTLNLVKDACFVDDRAEIEKIFKKILQQAEEHGIVYDNEEKVFKLKKVERLVFSLKE